MTGPIELVEQIPESDVVRARLAEAAGEVAVLRQLLRVAEREAKRRQDRRRPVESQEPTRQRNNSGWHLVDT